MPLNEVAEVLVFKLSTWIWSGSDAHSKTIYKSMECFMFGRIFSLDYGKKDNVMHKPEPKLESIYAWDANTVLRTQTF